MITMIDFVEANIFMIRLFIYKYAGKMGLKDLTNNSLEI